MGKGFIRSLISCAAMLVAGAALAQSPSAGGNEGHGRRSWGPTEDTLVMQADVVTFGADGGVRSRGNVELYYKDYLLTADEVIYDKGRRTLTAVGNVVLREPNGNVSRSDRGDMTGDFRDAFERTLVTPPPDRN